MYPENYPKSSLESSADVGTPPKLTEPPHAEIRISELVPQFVRYAQYEMSLSAQTAKKYHECLNWIIRDIGDLPVKSLDLGYVTMLKQKVVERGAGASRLASITFALKGFLRFCQEVMELSVMDYKKIRAPKLRRREVVYLTNEEIQQFIDSIKFENEWRGGEKKRCLRLNGLRFRTLVEVLLGTGMRVSEVISLNRSAIDFEKGEAKIIGKGDKQRTVFFNQRSLDWIKFYLEQRTDQAEPLFVTHGLKRLHRADVDKIFRGYAKKSGIGKPISPHILRHTMATNLLFNGCPISHVKEILGHDRLETTCRYYLGVVDKNKAKQAHRQFLQF